MIKKNILPLTFILALTTLAGCTPSAEQVMAPLQYTQQINCHVKKNASLNWEAGEVYSSMVPPTTVSFGGTAGVVPTLIAASIISEERHRNPGSYTFTYDKAQQAVFMTSLKNVLQQNEVFNNVALITDPQDSPAKDVLITINFRTTKIAGNLDNYKITLDVDMFIKENRQPPFKRTYFVMSDPGGVFSRKDFREQQTDVSSQLLGKIIAGITQWQKQRYSNT
jgi:hypothetical protein